MSQQINRVRYTLNDVNDIKFSGFNYELPERANKIIQKIAKLVGAPTYVKTPVFKKRMHYNNQSSPQHRHRNEGQERQRRNRGNKQEVSIDDLKQIRNFTVTKITKQEGVDKMISNSRNNLTKLSEQTYDSISDDIIDQLRDYSDEITEEEMNRITENIFDIGSRNRFYTHLYAKFYKELIGHFSNFKVVMNERYTELGNSMHNFRTCDEKKDYDLFCDINKENDHRRSKISFIGDLATNGLISPNDYLNTFKVFINNFDEKINDEENKPVCEEIAEIMNIMFDKAWDYVKNEEDDESKTIIDDVKTFIKLYASKRPSYKPGLTNNTIFKFMDIEEKYM